MKATAHILGASIVLVRLLRVYLYQGYILYILGACICNQCSKSSMLTGKESLCCLEIEKALALFDGYQVIIYSIVWFVFCKIGYFGFTEVQYCKQEQFNLDSILPDLHRNETQSGLD